MSSQKGHTSKRAKSTRFSVISGGAPYLSCWRDVAFSCGGVRLDASSHQYAGRITGKSGTMQLVRASRLAGGDYGEMGTTLGQPKAHLLHCSRVSAALRKRATRPTGAGYRSLLKRREENSPTCRPCSFCRIRAHELHIEISETWTFPCVVCLSDQDSVRR
jgi:hypothetical protein